MSANEYARQRGRDQPSPPAPLPQAGEGRKLPPLTTEEQARVAGNRMLVRALMPELLPTIRELHDLGMIDGWRNVSIEPIQSDTGSQA